MSLFEMSEIVIKILEQKLIMYHGLFQQNKCEAKEMEELVASALDIDPVNAGFVDWKSGSHTPGSDIIIHNNNKLSIKSGTIEKNMIVISGNRLTKAKENFNIINSLLKSYISDVMICFIYNQINGCYQIFYIDSNVFMYPDSAKSWKPIVSKKSGLISSWCYIVSNGMLIKITPAMSWQVWWYVPLNISRMGPNISTRKSI